MSLLAQIFSTLSALVLANDIAEAIDTEIAVVTLVFVLFPLCYGLQMVVDDMWMGKKGKPLSPAWLLAAEVRLAQVRDGVLPRKADAPPTNLVSAGSIDSDGQLEVEQTTNPVSSSAAPESQWRQRPPPPRPPPPRPRPLPPPRPPTVQDREWFAKLDGDASGLLSKAEAKAMMLDFIQAGDYAITEAWFESTWRVVDVDDNNELDIHAFATLMKLVSRQHNSNRNVAQPTDEDLALFKQLDKNGDGKLGQKECIALIKSKQYIVTEK
jgi:Ca2+-binding EF-hand superfamily protein